MLAPQDEPARHRSRSFRYVSLAQRTSVCFLYVSCQSRFTPKYAGDGLCGRGVPSRWTASWRLDFQFFRWNDVIVVLAELSLSLYVFRYSVISAKLVVSAYSTMYQFLWK